MMLHHLHIITVDHPNIQGNTDQHKFTRVIHHCLKEMCAHKLLASYNAQRYHSSHHNGLNRHVLMLCDVNKHDRVFSVRSRLYTYKLKKRLFRLYLIIESVPCIIIKKFMDISLINQLYFLRPSITISI